MYSQKVRLLLVSFLVAGGLLGCKETPQPGIEDLKAVISEAQKECGEKLGIEAVITNSIGMQFVLIPPGEFTMGAPDSDDMADDDEKPQHKVKITKSFLLGVHEVTQQQYEKVMGKNPSGFKGARNPVENVSWNYAMEFCKKLSTKEGKTYRLPTEAEWEYACRAGTTTRYSYDEPDYLGEYAWYRDNSDRRTHPVGGKKPNAWALHDMHGNVWEWCADWYGFYASEEVSDRSGPETGSHRVYRGGCWVNWAEFCRSASRGRLEPTYHVDRLGFRVVLSLSGE